MHVPAYYKACAVPVLGACSRMRVDPYMHVDPYIAVHITNITCSTHAWYGVYQDPPMCLIAAGLGVCGLAACESILHRE